jgi:hypothetical protein
MVQFPPEEWLCYSIEDFEKNPAPRPDGKLAVNALMAIR